MLRLRAAVADLGTSSYVSIQQGIKNRDEYKRDEELEDRRNERVPEISGELDVAVVLINGTVSSPSVEADDSGTVE